MILSDLTGYLARHRRVALMDLSHRLDASPDAVRGMLAALERKGRVRRTQDAPPCAGSCCKCDPATLETYDWIGTPADAGQSDDGREDRSPNERK